LQLGSAVQIAQDITETLNLVARQWTVIQTVRKKFSCRDCEKITLPQAPFHAKLRSLFDPRFHHSRHGRQKVPK
jgi:transposase